MAKVTITQITPLVVPTPMGQVGVQLFGLGDDGLPYVWDGKNKKWELA